MMMLKILGDIRYKEKSSSFIFSGHTIPHYEMIYVDRGALHIVVGHRHFLLTEGELCLLPPGKFHRVAGDKMHPPNMVDVHFSTRFHPVLRLACQKILLTKNERFLMQELIRKKEGRIQYHLEETGSFLACLLFLLLRRFKKKEFRGDRQPSFRRNYHEILVEEAKRYMNEHLRESLTILSIAQALHLSPSLLSHAFTAIEAQGVMRYFCTTRIAVAKDLLRNSALSITEIADRVGFSTIHHFSRVFKAKTGFTPTQYARSLH